MNTLLRIALNNNKKNKVRSTLVFITVMLACCLLCILLTYGYGFVKDSRENAGSYYGAYYGSFRGIGLDKWESIKGQKEFEKTGLVALVAEIENKSTMELYWCDKTANEMLNLDISLLEGTYPENENEIAGDMNFFKKIGYEGAKVGDVISVSLRSNNTERYSVYSFLVSGVYENSPSYSQSYTGYVAEEFYKTVIPENRRTVTVYFSLSEEMEITSATAEEVIKALGERYGIEENNISTNSYYLTWALDPGYDTILVIACAALFVMAFSALIIYNIFQIGLVDKIKEYGKIKAIGATKGQLKGVILLEGMSVAAFGIPLGMILGCFLSKWTFGLLLEQSAMVYGDNVREINIFSVPILLLVLCVSLLTVFIALLKPIRIIGRLSPMEAIRVHNDGGKTKLRHGSLYVGLKSVILANMMSNKKRVISTILTLGLSCMVFVAVGCFVSNIDNEYDARQEIEYGKFLISLDYSLHDAAYPENNLDNMLADNPLNNDFIRKVTEIEGVTEVMTRNILVMKNSNGELMSVAVLNREEFQNYVTRGSVKGELEYDKVTEETGVVFGWSYFMEQYGYIPGNQMEMTLWNGQNQVKLAGTINGGFGNAKEFWYITEDVYKKLGYDEESIGHLWVECEEEDIKKVEITLIGLLEEEMHLKLYTYENAYEASKFNSSLIRLISYSFLAIVGAIGFLNMANTIIISVITRKREIGVLQAVGMTNRQVNIMLQVEGLLYTGGTILLAITGGLPCGWFLFVYGKKNGWIGLHQFHWPVCELLLMTMALVLLQGTLSFVLSQNIKKESLIERIRY